MIERIKEIMNEKNLSSSLFADEIGITRASMSHLLSGRNNPSLDIIQKILHQFPDIDSDWLLFGNGRKTSNIKEEFEKVRNTDMPLFKQEYLNKEVEAKSNIEKIVFFFKDGTFKQYNPS